ncbi:hypothetical protein GCM10010238_41580 [Streptomyces griseoviridis]|uniref:Uncharacterized protein n=1 Tax=Streptomyces griseoviridis TaxID=45398 RepID=A0A918GM34_STRGD|nr:hypothetical protein GCM10010238_41580 [Streptomyces niveoruber]
MESGYVTRQAALDRLTRGHEEKRTTPRAQADLKREIGQQRFGHHTSTRPTRQRHHAPGSVRPDTHVLNGRILALSPHGTDLRFYTRTSEAAEGRGRSSARPQAAAEGSGEAVTAEGPHDTPDAVMERTGLPSCAGSR